MLFLLFVFVCVSNAALIDGTAVLYQGGLPDPILKTCGGNMIDTQTTPNATTGAFTFSTVLARSPSSPYCIQMIWSATNVASLTQINGYMTRVSGNSGNGGGIQLAMPVVTQSNTHVLYGSQVGILFPGCLAPLTGSNQYNLHTFTFQPTPLVSDTLEGTGIAFNVAC
jgi:hypothetical protein